MMGHRQVEQAALFYEFSLERHIPGDHLLRSIDRFVEFGELRRELAPFYSTLGRPSIDPELMIRMLIVGYCFGIRSERRRTAPGAQCLCQKIFRQICAPARQGRRRAQPAARSSAGVRRSSDRGRRILIADGRAGAWSPAVPGFASRASAASPFQMGQSETSRAEAEQITMTRQPRKTHAGTESGAAEDVRREWPCGLMVGA